MAHFGSYISTRQITDKIWRLNMPLIYQSDLIKEEIVVPANFYCDGESVPRIPLVYACLGHTSLRGGFVHDFLYRKDAYPSVSRAKADAIYQEISILTALEDLKTEDKHATVLRMAKIKSQAWSKWVGVRAGGWMHWKKKTVDWRP